MLAVLRASTTRRPPGSTPDQPMLVGGSPGGWPRTSSLLSFRKGACMTASIVLANSALAVVLRDRDLS
jgi:hypothetical protein